MYKPRPQYGGGGASVGCYDQCRKVMWPHPVESHIKVLTTGQQTQENKNMAPPTSAATKASIVLHVSISAPPASVLGAELFHLLRLRRCRM